MACHLPGAIIQLSDGFALIISQETDFNDEIIETINFVLTMIAPKSIACNLPSFCLEKDKLNYESFTSPHIVCSMCLRWP